MFQVGLPCYLGLNSGRLVSINLNKTRKHFSRNVYGARMFPQCLPVHHTGNTVFWVSFCFQDANHAYATRQENLTKIRACEHLQKFCEHGQASTHLIFASNSSKGQIFRALSNWMGPFDILFFFFFLYKNNVFPAQVDYFIFSVDFRLKAFFIIILKFLMTFLF